MIAVVVLGHHRLDDHAGVLGEGGGVLSEVGADDARALCASMEKLLETLSSGKHVALKPQLEQLLGQELVLGVTLVQQQEQVILAGKAWQ